LPTVSEILLSTNNTSSKDGQIGTYSIGLNIPKNHRSLSKKKKKG